MLKDIEISELFKVGDIIMVNGTKGIIEQFNPGCTITVVLDRVIESENKRYHTNRVVVKPVVGFSITKVLF